MEKIKQRGIMILGGVALLGIIFGYPLITNSEDGNSKYNIPDGVYIDLTRDFYQTLKQEGAGGITYTNDPSVQYLKQIAISARFMVETNLQILKQQEDIRQMLQSVLEKRKR